MARFFMVCVCVVLFAVCFRPSYENRRRRVCLNPYGDPRCLRKNQICCNFACNSTCVGKRCNWDFQCSTNRIGHKCCSGYCQPSCEGHSCRSARSCKDRSLKCCNGLCRKESCLGAACSNSLSPYKSCGIHGRRRLDCCSGKCELTCKDKPCYDNKDCGGRSNKRMKCCNGVCRKNCLGSPCYDYRDCQSNYLDCCGFFGNKICASSCRNHQCSLQEKYECGRRRNPKLFCCGDGTCRPTCFNSICFTETFRYDCKAPGKLFYCCGMGQKRCRSSCSHVRCEKHDDCGESKYYCGRPDRHNISTCRFTYLSDIISRHDVRLDELEFN
ncbi:keratin-associated protein 5-5-like [Dendronephthya gigantea]|uniref:keratin-associated protein 5-5-like n=1 Tax=Dendronephthya gigantea TaxID=151771 RepID=UPI00106CDAC2|nr:keratin-associated protein 5-5-like [Dendronephthya gigantea]